VTLAKASRKRLLSISAASIDRLLRSTRQSEQHRLCGLSGTYPASEVSGAAGWGPFGGWMPPPFTR